MLAGSVLILAIPTFLALWLSLLILQGRPVFHIAERVGQHRRPFRMWKFRTMSIGQALGPYGGHCASATTRLGWALRRQRLDELPQLFSVIRGDMSLVGPRPPLPFQVSEHASLYASMLHAKPGLTGLATLTMHRWEDTRLRRIGSANEANSVHGGCLLTRKVRLEAIYRRRQSIRLDLMILACSVLRVAVPGARSRPPRLARAR